MMEISSRFREIKEFLKRHQFLCDWEALMRYPLEDNVYMNWVKELALLSDEQKYELENTLSPELISEKYYKSFLKTINELTKLETPSTPMTEFDSVLGRKIKEKKRHEILIIFEQLKDLKIDHYIDVGSGAGHLSSLLLMNNQKSAECIDMNEENQEIGIKKLKKDFPEILSRIKFTPKKVEATTKFSPTRHSALIGLHCCGNLSVDLIKNFCREDFSALLNYGCCYHKLTEDHINISEQAKSEPLYLTNHALTMATKSYKTISKKEWGFRKRVKIFRYGLHIYLTDHLGTDFISLGNGTSEDYQGSFSDYCFKFYPSLAGHTTKKDLEAFLQSTKTQTKIQELLDLGMIRSHVARLIELYIILDRALYLQDKGFRVDINETFNRDISPRNISLMAQRQN